MLARLSFEGLLCLMLKRFHGVVELFIHLGLKSVKVVTSVKPKSMALSNLRKGSATFVFVTCRGALRK